MAVAKQLKSEMTSYLNSSNDVMNGTAKIEKFLPHSIVTPNFMTVGSQMPDLDGEGVGGFPPSCILGSQNTPYILGLMIMILMMMMSMHR